MCWWGMWSLKEIQHKLFHHNEYNYATLGCDYCYNEAPKGLGLLYCRSQHYGNCGCSTHLFPCLLNSGFTLNVDAIDYMEI